MKIINNTPWSSAQLRTIARQVASEELDTAHMKITTIIFAPKKYEHRAHGMLEVADLLDCAIIARIYLESPEDLRREGTGWCKRDDCRRPYAHHWIADHAFEPIRVDLRLKGPRVAFEIAHELQHGLGRDDGQMLSKYLDHDYGWWWWAPDVTLGRGRETDVTAPAQDRREPATASNPAPERAVISKDARRGASRKGRR